MAEFLDTLAQNDVIKDIFKDAKKEIIIVSPFIKIPPLLKDALMQKREDSISLRVVFGKNEDNVSKSIDIQDIDFFKTFNNVEIRYDSRLHAKYYGNEEEGLSTSMNLYSFSSGNNKEIGILVRKNILLNLHDRLGNNGIGVSNPYGDLKKLVEEIISNADLLYKKVPQYSDKLLGLMKEYTDSKVEVDKLNQYFTSQTPFQQSINKKKELIKEVASPTSSHGYCIRTGEPIPFNLKQPMAREAFVSWARFENKEYSEKFCHYSGEPSNGETSFEKPILGKNWKKAKEIFKF